MTTLHIDREARVRHETGHAAALVALGKRVHSVDVIDHGHHRQGFTAHDHRVTDKASAIVEAKHTMCALISEGRVPTLAELDHSAVTSTDEQRLAHIAHALEWDEDDYQALVNDSVRLMGTDRYCKAHRAISNALENTDQLDEHDLRRLLPERKAFATRWVLPETFDQMGLRILRARDAEIERKRVLATEPYAWMVAQPDDGPRPVAGAEPRGAIATRGRERDQTRALLQTIHAFTA